MDGLFPRSQQIHYGEQKADPAYAIGATDGCERQFWLVELYYQLVFKFVYGILYK